jgi:hypothetical protein
MVFQNRVLGRIFGPEKGVTGQRKLYIDGSRSYEGHMHI